MLSAKKFSKRVEDFTNFEQILELSFGPVKKELIENQGSVAWGDRFLFEKQGSAEGRFLL